MTVWILAIVGIVMLMVVVDVILPEGDTNKYIKGVMSIVMIFVIVQPLPSLLENNVNFIEEFAGLEQTWVDQSLLNSITEAKESYCEQNIELILSKNGFDKVMVDVHYTDNGEKIEFVQLNLTNLVIDKNSNHIFITEQIEKLLKQFGVEKEQIRYEYAD